MMLAIETEARVGARCALLYLVGKSSRRTVGFESDGRVGGHASEMVHYLDEDGVDDLRRRAEALLRAGNRPGLAREARALGQLFYRLLLPEKIRERVASLRIPLAVHASGIAVPWELVHDGDDFWAARYAIGRMPDRRLQAPVARGPSGDLRVLLVGSDPLGALPFVEEEMERLSRLFEPLGPVTRLSGAGTTRAAIRGVLGERYDIVHVCGAAHTVESDMELQLTNGEHIGIGALGRSIAGHPLIVLDVCAGERGTPVPRELGWDDRMAQVASSWLSGGALGVVGAVTSVGHRQGAHLLEHFYARVMQGSALGEALRSARAEARAAEESSPAWLSFALHGNPCTALPLRHPSIGKPSTTVRVPLNLAAPAPRWRIGRRLAKATAVLLLAAAVWTVIPDRDRLPVEIVLGERVDDPVVHATARDVVATVRDALARLARSGRARLDVAAAREALCDGTSMPRCLGLLRRSRRSYRVVVTPLRPVEGSYVDELNVAEFAPDGALLFEGRVVETRERDGALASELLATVLRGLHVDVDAASRRSALPPPEQLAGYRLLHQSLVGSDVAPVGREGAPAFLGAGTRSWRTDGRRAQDIAHFLDWYAGALTAGSVGEIASVQPQMGDAQRAALQRYLAYARGIEVSFSDVHAVFDGDRALVSAWRRDTIRPADGTAMDFGVRVHLVLQHWGRGWFVHDQQDANGRWQHMRRRIDRRLARTPAADSWLSRIRAHLPGRGVDAPPAELAPVPSALFVADFGGSHATSWQTTGDTEAAVAPYGAQGAGALRVSGPDGAAMLPVPIAASLPNAETVRLVVRAEDRPIRLRVVFPTLGRPARFWRELTVEPGPWQAIELPLRFFRWSHSAVPTWDDVDRLLLERVGGGSLLVDHVELDPGRLRRAAYLTPYEIKSIAFDESGTTRVRRVEGNLPWIILTDAPALDAQTLLRALERTYRMVREDLPSLPEPTRRIVLLVFANEDESRRFWPRFSDRFQLQYPPGDEQDAAAMGLGVTWFHEGWQQDPGWMLSTCVHEAVHALTAQMIGLAGGSAWLFEGLAVRYGRAAAGIDGFARTQRELAKGVPALEELVSGELAPYHGYLPAELAVEWLLGDPRRRNQVPGLVRLMQQRGSVDLRPLAQSQLGAPMATLDSEWREWLRSRYGSN